MTRRFETLSYYPKELIFDVDGGRPNDRRPLRPSPIVWPRSRNPSSLAWSKPRTCRPTSSLSSPRPSGDSWHVGFPAYVPDRARLPELTISAVLLGSVLGIIFGASSLYLFLKVSMTVSASIPVAVLAITIFRGLSRAFGIRRATILENNVVQTAGLGRRIDRVRRRRRHAGPDAPGIRAGTDACHAGGRTGRIAGNPDDDPAAARLHRQAARRAPLPRRNGLRQSPDRRRTGWFERQDRLPGSRLQLHLSAAHAGVQVLGRNYGSIAVSGITGLQQGGRIP